MKLRHPARRLPTAFAGGETVPAGEGQAPREGAVAQLGLDGETFETVQEAIDAAALSGDTVYPLQDVAEYVTISTGSVTLNLNGHTLSEDSTNDQAQATLHVKGGDLTIEDTVGRGSLPCELRGARSRWRAARFWGLSIQELWSTSRVLPPR